MTRIPPIASLPARTRACEGMDGTRPCNFFAEVLLGRARLCRMHAVEQLNMEHQAAVEAVHKTVQVEP